ncbi:hypothetical protein SIAM614_00447 [Stappia aggregata IAM 12614]|uniref:Winged helix-turn helix domain-containing protein n=2 Tax=Roseibium aggregatum TaxID=187304 RepID=A0P2L2_ROSAI|nr:hypothetical protein SIAM614_00447 [Stappia aggregata IAM 12614] [Roseibium aggregatum IAM 12614]
MVAWLHEAFGVSVYENTVSGALKDMGFIKLSARRAHHGQIEHALEAFKKTSPQISKLSEPVWTLSH